MAYRTYKTRAPGDTSDRKSAKTTKSYAKKDYPPANPQAIINKIKLSQEQEIIIDAILNGKGDIIVNACPGSGKTSLIEQGIARLSKTVPEFQICACTFSRDMKAELERRLTGLALVRTTMSLGFEAVRNHFKSVKGNEWIVSEWKYKELALSAAKQLKDEITFSVRGGDLTINQLRWPLYNAVNHCQLSLIDPEDLEALSEVMDKFDIEFPYQIEIATVSRYVMEIFERGKRMAAQGQISFSDQIWLPNVYDMPLRSFPYVFVDECQDLSPAQRGVVLKMRATAGRMFFVGDAWQSIFGFAGADIDSMGQIERATAATPLPMNTCFRCPVEVLNWAQTINPEVQPAPNAPMGIVDHIEYEKVPGFVRANDLVLCRKTKPLVELCLELVRNRVPAFVKGRDIGEGLIALIEEASEYVRSEPFTYAKLPEFLYAVVDAHIARMEADNRLSESKVIALHDKMASIITCYQAFIECKDVECLIEQIRSLFNDRERAVILSTVHRAKGGQAHRVFILEPESLPMSWVGQKDWERRQELNVCFVCYTRVVHDMSKGIEGEMYFIER
jgi:superfamily I DNA/RNA helicase